MLAEKTDTTKLLENPDSKLGFHPNYKVLLHNDDVNDMVYVIETIKKLTPLSIEEAIQKMTEAHKTGVALLLVTHKERAELYQEQFASCRLTVTIEPE
jgi:ATP-dependent Clp protease adaptor protein ClpS